MSKSLNRRTRAYFRHQKFRIRRKCREIAKKWYSWGTSNEELHENAENYAKKMEKTRVTCSDPVCCGNPRHLKGRNEQTLQEKRAEIAEKEQKEELLGKKSDEMIVDEWVEHIKNEQVKSLKRGLND